MRVCWNNFTIAFLLFYFVQIKLNSQTPGSIDPDFGINGKVEIRDSSSEYFKVHTVSMPDGKIIILSMLYVPNGNAKIVLTRLLSNGDRDNAFGLNGQLFPEININLGKYGAVTKIVATGDNKLILSGYTTTVIGPNGAAFVARLNVNGELDEAFVQGGVQLFDYVNYWDKFLSVLIKPDGKILLGGYSAGITMYRLFLVQLHPNGILDSGFATGGIYISNPVEDFRGINSISLQSDGKIVTFGTIQKDTCTDMEILRFNVNGTLDESFASNGSLKLGLPERENIAYAGAIQPNKKIVFCGASYYYATPNGAITLSRINPDGDLDYTFGTAGEIFIDYGQYDRESTMLLQPDMKILVGSVAFSDITYHLKFWLTRYNSDGSLDKTFGNGGTIQSPDYLNTYELGNILLDVDGKIVYSYIAEGKVVLYRYLNDNALFTEEPKSDFVPRLYFVPNPVSDYGSIKWMMQKPGELRGELFDTQGRFIKQIIPPAYHPAGTYQQEVNIEKNIFAGVYYLVFTTGSDRHILKLVKF